MNAELEKLIADGKAEIIMIVSALHADEKALVAELHDLFEQHVTAAATTSPVATL